VNAADRLIRVITAGTVVALGAIAAVVSYRHAYQVAATYGETGLTAALTPLTPDGLVLVASLVMLDAARRDAQAPALARWALGMGVAATVAVNVLHGLDHGLVGAVVAAWPAVTLVVVVELLMGLIRRGRSAPPVPPVATAEGTGLEHPAPMWWPLPALDVPPALDRIAVATGPGPDGPQVAGPGEQDGAPEGEVSPEMIATARERFAETLATGGLPSIREIRRKLHVGYPKAKALRAAADRRGGALTPTSARGVTAMSAPKVRVVKVRLSGEGDDAGQPLTPAAPSSPAAGRPASGHPGLALIGRGGQTFAGYICNHASRIDQLGCAVAVEPPPFPVPRP